MMNLLMNTDLLIALTCFALILFAVWDAARRWEAQEREAARREIKERERQKREERERYMTACLTPHKYEPPPLLTYDKWLESQAGKLHQKFIDSAAPLYSEKVWPDDELWPEGKQEKNQ